MEKIGENIMTLKETKILLQPKKLDIIKVKLNPKFKNTIKIILEWYKKYVDGNNLNMEGRFVKEHTVVMDFLIDTGLAVFNWSTSYNILNYLYNDNILDVINDIDDNHNNYEIINPKDLNVKYIKKYLVKKL